MREDNRMKYKCLDCGKEFKGWQVNEWLDEDGQDDEDGETPCCPYCDSDNVVDA